MKPKEAIKRLEQMKFDISHSFSYSFANSQNDVVVNYISQSIDAIEYAIKCAKKQIPKKPSFEGDGYDDEGELIYDTWVCPNCETNYECGYDIYDFCPHCGQAIDWSVVEEKE